MIPSEEWRRTFVTAMHQITAGDTVKLRISDWATKAQAQHGHRNPVQVGHEEYTSGKRPPSN